MKAIHLVLPALFFAVISCTLDKTDFEEEIAVEIPENYSFEEVFSSQKETYKISVEALNGTFYKGYNEVRVKLTNVQTEEFLANSTITFFPVLTVATKQETCPHASILEYNSDEQYFEGYVVFTKDSNVGDWNIQLNFTTESGDFQVDKIVSVVQQPNKNLNMTSFIGNDEQYYIIALIAPQKPKVAENNLVAGIYKYVGDESAIINNEPNALASSFAVVNKYTLLLDPRMPEPSMGNHSSPNNRDLIQGEDGLYHGVVNYTMTGNWTLNFIMQNQNGKIVKGTEVSTDFTPGVEGEKSELYIDILF